MVFVVILEEIKRQIKRKSIQKILDIHGFQNYYTEKTKYKMSYFDSFFFVCINFSSQKEFKLQQPWKTKIGFERKSMKWDIWYWVRNFLFGPVKLVDGEITFCSSTMTHTKVLKV